jgi:eukaryotic-like serine/threonine-protein kinase
MSDHEPTVPEPSREARAKQLVETRYEILETLGRGGMGEVVAARDRVLGREIAIKRMIADSPSDTEVTRFLREARIQGWLDHPSIPPLHELAFDADAQPYFVMKRLVGTTLADVLEELARGNAEIAKRFPRERLLRALTEVCLAIEFAHTRGVIHRDLKPGNIMLGEFGEVFVLDWGVAKLVGIATDFAQTVGDKTPSRDATQAGAVVGTPSYMAPEQRAADADIDARADVYSLGRVLQAILRPSISGESDPAAMRDAPPELDDIALAATRTVRADRIQTARELADRIQRYLDGDRDLVERRRLATEHLARAHAALAGSADEGRAAMQEAGRALALDPTLPGAAELVGRLMLEPPAETPREVVASLEANGARAQIEQARSGRFAAACCTAFLPAFYWSGVRDPSYYAAIGAVIAVLLVLTTYGARHPLATTGLPIRAVLVIATFSVLIATLARLTSPFVVAPSVAVVAAALLCGAPAYRNPRIVTVMLAGFVGAFLVPAIAELLGLIRPTFALDDRALTIFAPADAPESRGILMGLLAWAVGSVVVSTLLTLRRARSEQTAQRLLHVQAWRLRQLLPPS